MDRLVWNQLSGRGEQPVCWPKPDERRLRDAASRISVVRTPFGVLPTGPWLVQVFHWTGSGWPGWRSAAITTVSKGGWDEFVRTTAKDSVLIYRWQTPLLESFPAQPGFVIPANLTFYPSMPTTFCVEDGGEFPDEEGGPAGTSTTKAGMGAGVVLAVGLAVVVVVALVLKGN